MKTIIVIFFAILSVSIASAQSVNEWRLSKTFYKGPDWTGSEEYTYDTNNRIKEVKYYQDKKLFYTSTNFKYNADNNITYFEEHYTNGKYGPKDPLIYYFTYNNAGKLQTKEKHTIKGGKDKLLQSFTYEWGIDNVKVEDKLSTFGGIATTVRTYKLDSKKNITSTESNMAGQISTDNFSAYDNHAAPELFTSYPFKKEIISANNATKLNYSFGEIDNVVKVNADGLVVKIEEHAKFVTNAPVNYNTYSYVKIKK